LDRSQFAEKALQSVKNTFIHFPESSLRSFGSVRRSCSVPKDVGSFRNHWEMSCYASNSLLPRNDALGIGDGSAAAAKLDMTNTIWSATDSSPANSDASSHDFASTHGNLSPMSGKFGCWVGSPVSTADNTPTNSDDDFVRCAQQPSCAMETSPVHARATPWDRQSQQQLMKLRATGQALMLELQSKTDTERQHESKQPFLLQSSNSPAHNYQFGVSRPLCHNEFGTHWVFQQ